MMIPGKWGLAGNSAIALLCMQFSTFPAEPGERMDTATACDTTNNHKNWYLDRRECGSNGSQYSLLANLSTMDVRGSQFSLLANVATENVEQAQMAGTFNLARRVHSQLFADVNIAQHISALQMGGVNIADTADGTQLGFLNIANHLGGYGIGFLTLADNGLLHVDGSVEETGMEKLTFASGKGLFTSYSLGYTIGDPGHPYSFGMGFGYHQDFSGLYAEGEVSGALVLDKNTPLKDLDDKQKKAGDPDWRNNLLVQAKLRLGGPLFGRLGIFGGISYNALGFKGTDRLMRSWTEDLTSTSKDAVGWPGAEVGIRLGR